jgi:uncharacterized protein YegP (UPF0339 family)
MAGCYELSKSKNDQFCFVFKSEKEDTLLISELYTTKASAQNGIASVQKHSGSETAYERKRANNGQFFFNIKAANHEVIATSLMYTDEGERESSIALVKAHAGTEASIKDKTT